MTPHFRVDCRKNVKMEEKGMNVTFEIPDDLAPRLAAGGCDLTRTALEIVRARPYRRGPFPSRSGQRLLGIETSYELGENARCTCAKRDASSLFLHAPPQPILIEMRHVQMAKPCVRCV